MTIFNQCQVTELALFDYAMALTAFSLVVLAVGVITIVQSDKPQSRWPLVVKDAGAVIAGMVCIFFAMCLTWSFFLLDAAIPRC